MGKKEIKSAFTFFIRRNQHAIPNLLPRNKNRWFLFWLGSDEVTCVVEGSKLFVDDFMSLAPESRGCHEVWRIMSLLHLESVQCRERTFAKKLEVFNVCAC